MEKPSKNGRPGLFDEEALKILERIAREHPTATWEELGRLVAEKTGIKAGRNTLEKRLSELGFQRMTVPRPKALDAENVGHEPKRYGYDDRHREVAAEALYPHGMSDADGSWSEISSKTRRVEYRASTRAAA